MTSAIQTTPLLPERALVNLCALADQTHFHTTIEKAGVRFKGRGFYCEKCRNPLPGDARHYPGSHLANQPSMQVCEDCETKLFAAALTARANAPQCTACKHAKAAFPTTGRCWPCEIKAQSAPAPRVIILPIAFEMLARAEKSRIMAAQLIRAGISADDAARMTSGDWAKLHEGLKATGILKPNGTTPSPETIRRTLEEMRTLEAKARATAPAPMPRGYASIAPGIAVRVRRRRAA